MFLNVVLFFCIPLVSMAGTTMHLDRIWQVGLGDHETIFGVVKDIEIGPDGHVWILDSQLHRVVRIDDQGALVTVIGQPGEGPDDLTQPVGIEILPDGSIAVFEAQPPALKIFGADGVLSESKRFGSGMSPGSFCVQAALAGGTIAVAGYDFAVDNGILCRRNWIKTLGLDGESATEVVASEVCLDSRDLVLDEREQRSFVTRWDLRDDGLLAVAPEFEAFRIDLYGDVDHHLMLPGELVRRTSDEIQQIQEEYRRSTGGAPDARIVVSDYQTAIPMITMAPSGKIWCWLGPEESKRHGVECLGAFVTIDPDTDATDAVILVANGRAGGAEVFAVGSSGLVVGRTIGVDSKEAPAEDIEAGVVVEYYELPDGGF